MEDEVYYHHFRVHKDNRGPAVTVAFRKPKEGTTAIYIGLAFCSPLDSFSRKRGRTIAKGRLDKNPALAYIMTGDTFPYRESIEKSGIWMTDEHWPRWLDKGVNLQNCLEWAMLSHEEVAHA